MLFTESYLGTNPFSILDEGVYLTENESCTQPHTLPIIENSRLGVVQIPYYAIEQFTTENGCSLAEAISIISESHSLKHEDIVINIQEDEIILDPSIVNESVSIVVSPISSMDSIYQLCEDYTNAYLENEDDQYLLELGNPFEWIGNQTADLMSRKEQEKYSAAVKQHDLKFKINQKLFKDLNDATDSGNKQLRDQLYEKWEQSGKESTDAFHKKRKAYIDLVKMRTKGHTIGKYGSISLAAFTSGVVAQRLVQAYRNKPKSVIAKKIASLRQIYSKWMQKAASSRDQGLAAKLKRGAAKILQVIDKLMGYLQNKADGR